MPILQNFLRDFLTAVELLPTSVLLPGEIHGEKQATVYRVTKRLT